MLNKMKAVLKSEADKAMHWLRRCNGADNLGLTIIIAALILVLLGRLLRLQALTLLSAALYLWAFYRMLSHNVAKRHEENRRFKELLQKCRTELGQGLARLKNIRKYKYYRCPNCKSRLRMPRGIGEKTVTCSKCGHSFRKKA